MKGRFPQDYYKITEGTEFWEDDSTGPVIFIEDTRETEDSWPSVIQINPLTGPNRFLIKPGWGKLAKATERRHEFSDKVESFFESQFQSKNTHLHERR